ncbi:MAG TPA: hypothetical protein VN700_06470 [Vicinamibacterales bacterium]|nr:hypothetical protein [Vicinamibacterales bacterium]
MALTIKDALRLASKDPVFANELVNNPTSLKTHFHLSDAQVTQLKQLGTAAAGARTHLGVVGGHAGPGGPQADYD